MNCPYKKMKMKLSYKMLLMILVLFLSACSGGKGGPIDPNFSGGTDTPFTIRSESELIGGPVAQGRVGDILLKNDKIRVIIQKPRKNSGVNSFGGNIIDADVIRDDGTGNDNFGSLFPLVNVEWTVNYHKLEVISDGSDGGAKVVRAYGIIDVYDYLDLDFIGDVAEGIAGQKISYSNRFDDRRNPFTIYEDLGGLGTDVVTDYILDAGSNFVKIETTFVNNGDKEVKFPVGQFVNGSGEVSTLIPGVGFSPDAMTQIAANTPAIIYTAFDTSDVSYGYFFDVKQFPKSSSITFSGLTGLLMGEEFLKLLPFGNSGTPDIHFSIEPGKSRKVTGYFVVGGGSAGSVLDTGLVAIGADARPINGSVTDADGKPMENATVAILTKGQTLITYRTDGNGVFSGMLPTGGNAESKQFGSGHYSIAVEKEGHHLNQKTTAGECEPVEIDIATKSSASIQCKLGETGTVVLSKPVLDESTGKPIAARLTIVGEDPSPNKVGSAGRFRSTIEWDQLFGVVAVKYITAKGTFDLTGKNNFNLEPGTYLFIVSHGPEYSTYELVSEVKVSGTVNLENVVINRVVTTPGYISADFHVHSIASPDSSYNQDSRVLSAAAESLDVLQSSDHDYITDYAPYAAKLMETGIIPQGSIQTSAGDEITPNHYGHIHAFPLEHHPDDPEGGAIDWSASPQDEVSPAPDYVMTIDEVIEKMRADPGEEVIQVNHIMDNPTGLLLATGWVTSPFYAKDFDVEPLSSYADPVERRMQSNGVRANFPLPFGTSPLVTKNFDAIELTIGPDMHDEGIFFRSALPSWFNLLNLGLIWTATADSDTHFGGVPTPIGIPRNYIASSVDPRDAKGGSHAEIDLEEYAHNINAHRLTVSAGPIVFMRAKSGDGSTGEIGETVTGSHVTFTVDVKAASWAWFDTIEIFANTEPIPVNDKTDTPMQGTAADPAEFYRPYHRPRYTYEPSKVFKLSDGTLTSWKEENGAITASVTFEMNVDEDMWVIALARGTSTTRGYRSLFPIVPEALVDPKTAPETIDPANLSATHSDKKVGTPAWGFTNPIFIDVNGDGFTAKYIADKTSPIAK